MRSFISLVFLPAILFFPIGVLAGADKETAASCSIYDAVYKPHPDYKPRDLDFELTVREALPGEGSSMRSHFLYFSAYDDDRNQVSMLRMGLGCTSSTCFISATTGQFHTNDALLEFATHLRFDPLAFNHALRDVPVWGPDAPYALVFQNTKGKFYRAKEQGDPFDEFVKYFTPNHTLPDFGGYDVWLLDRCNVNGGTPK
jgi:hypothetical protein